ncbi:MAG: dephospho-CoA kinase [Armatimonadetes bacterium]|nr:dephospho-CoA kinase [Armatimonadota bacterium]MBS1711208.1 dephospho-CoA kinase [Armatimonadota bacterium]MBX3108882.1 dephospho-CoA kinase [Fimbriimonadaceae bacterium]
MRGPLVVTGGVASGKSTVAGFLRECGWDVLDSDAVAREAFESVPVQDWLRSQLGERADLRTAARNRLGDREFRAGLNRLTHPYIYGRLREYSGDALEIPLLVESGLASAFGPVLVCDCPLDVARRRLEIRLGGRGAAEGLLASQAVPTARRMFADYLVRTDLPLDSVRQMVQTIAKSLR